MKRILAAAALISAVLMPVAAVSDTGLQDLFKREKSTLEGLPGRQLKSLLTATQPRGKIRTPEAPMNYSFAWLDAQPKATGGENWKCLSEALYFEARGETVKGQFAVAEVIVNRAKSSRFPDTICGVIRQGTGKKYQCQFTYTCDGRKEVIAEPRAYERVAKVARAILDGTSGDLTNGATYYHTVAVSPRWARKFTQTARIGVHLFYRPNYRTASND
ncbi:cell wall hydrolase [Seohaeicola saemankumensis]|nr:cell wall hydrolase [Seohaeicola saemankumensis]MCA0869754.1 cell wall hydrolase [Seohaeicola saemankumensis]